MRFDGPDPWVVLRVDAGYRRLWLARYTDDQQVTLEFSFAFDADRSEVNAALSKSLERASGAGVPLPIFIEHPSHDGGLDPQLLVRSFPSLEQSQAWLAIRCLAAARTELPPYALPLTIATVGVPARDSLAEFRSQNLVREALELEGLGFAYVDNAAELERGSHDVIIAGPDDAFDLLLIRPALSPRLIVVLAEHGFQRHLSVLARLRAHRWAAHTALIALATSERTASELNSLLLAIMHDTPLHAWVAGQRALEPRALLFATPATNQGLRMADAFATQARRELEDSIRTLQPDKPPSRNAEYQATSGLETTFDRAHGLIPLLRRERRAPRVVPTVAFEQRQTDARLERVDQVGPLDRGAPAHRAMWVGRDRTLRRGGRYRLRIQIGKPVPGNLISDSIPEADPRSTQTDGWGLHVVVSSKDFELRSDARRSLELPRHGGSEAIYFDLVAPKAGDAAQLRFDLYLGVHLQQSFVLVAALAHDELEHERGLHVRSASGKKATASTDAARRSARSNSGANGTRSFFWRFRRVLGASRRTDSLRR